MAEAAALPRANVDTDQIIPARFMSRSRSEGYGDQCFHDLRFNEHGTPARDFPLNHLKSPPGILVAADNFGCGSSREAAVYALMDYGVQVVIAPSFADIFQSNAGKNGLLTLEQPAEQVEKLLALLREKPGTKGEVDLPAQSWRIGSLSGTFEIAPRLKYRLERGLDELSATLEHQDRITAFEKTHLSPGTWRLPAAGGKIAARQASPPDAARRPAQRPSLEETK
ncbi:3-isopropylmalate dehydratase small subunit [Stappia sp. ES.058]|uniref:3-isopropylmalate dehydratase small subunit n=1 Tax=Stappia sp. ES.058 TaxID=1881061 RepID=UPI001FCDA0A9|nr:3-isopropylmalate dehydratase small subunit [Stappia sp. ES.058]